MTLLVSEMHRTIQSNMKTSTTREAITPAEYRAFQDAYDFFNKELLKYFAKESNDVQVF